MATPEKQGSEEVVTHGEKVEVAPSEAPKAAPATVAGHGRKRGPWLWIVAAIVVIGAVVVGTPWVMTALRTVSTDDAYVNGHATFVAPRVEGQVARVLVDDNNRVHKGDLLVQLDKEPYQTQVNIAQAAMVAAQADVMATEAQIRGQEGQTRSVAVYVLEHAIEDVDNQVAVLRSKVATLGSQQATLVKAQADYDRGVSVVHTGAITQEELDLRKEALSVAQAQVEQALQGVYQVRVSLGLPPRPETGDDLTEVPADLDQTFSSVKEAQARVMEAAAGLLGSYAAFNIWRVAEENGGGFLQAHDPEGKHRSHLRAAGERCFAADEAGGIEGPAGAAESGSGAVESAVLRCVCGD